MLRLCRVLLASHNLERSYHPICLSIPHVLLHWTSEEVLKLRKILKDYLRVEKTLQIFQNNNPHTTADVLSW
jgi:hypothetical protein